jgi:arylsulfatase B
MRNSLFLLLIFVPFLWCCAQRNTILIIADDLGTDYFGFYENYGDTVDVPNIRRLMNNGIRFQNFMSNPVCSSTRSTILTGRYGFRTGVGNIVGGVGGSGEIDLAENTIPKLLKKYNPNISTANIGKWHLISPNPAINLKSPQTLGYDWFEGPFIGGLPSFTAWEKYTNGIKSNVTTYATTETVNNAVIWLKSINKTNPFFLWLAFNAPHSPYHLPPNNLHSYTLSGTTNDINARPKEYFKASLQALDTEIGRLLDSLKSINKLDSTDIIFIGDNGNSTRTAQNGNTDKAKGTIYQYGVNVPLIISGPSVINKKRVSGAIVNSADLFATIIENFGYKDWANQIAPNKPVDGKSMVPIIKNEKDSIRAWAFCEMFKVTPDADDGKAIRNKTFKLIRFDNGQEEFYNLSNDYNEVTNLLKGNLTTNQQSNYNYLCRELNNLIGKTGNCGQVSINNEISNELMVYPNPFTSFIKVDPNYKTNFFTLTNAVGLMIYIGNEIEAQDFTNIPKGIYYLTSKIEQSKLVKY